MGAQRWGSLLSMRPGEPGWAGQNQAGGEGLLPANRSGQGQGEKLSIRGAPSSWLALEQKVRREEGTGKEEGEQ